MVARLLDDGWKVVVPWIVEAELERIEEREGLELVRADLFDGDAVKGVIEAGAGDSGAPLRGLVNLGGRLCRRGPRARDPD